MSRKKGYIFTNKDHAKKGIMATILGTISIGTLIFIIYFSYIKKGMIPEQYAATVLLVTLFSLTGLILGIIGLVEKDRFKLFPAIGLSLNVISLGLVGLILLIGAYGG